MKHLGEIQSLSEEKKSNIPAREGKVLLFGESLDKLAKNFNTPEEFNDYLLEKNPSEFAKWEEMASVTQRSAFDYIKNIWDKANANLTLAEEAIVKVMNRGSNASVEPEGILQMNHLDFDDWVKQNEPLKKAIHNWLVENKKKGTGSYTADLGSYLTAKGYKYASPEGSLASPYTNEAFAQYLKDIRKKPEEKMKHLD